MSSTVFSPGHQEGNAAANESTTGETDQLPTATTMLVTRNPAVINDTERAIGLRASDLVKFIRFKETNLASKTNAEHPYEVIFNYYARPYRVPLYTNAYNNVSFNMQGGLQEGVWLSTVLSQFSDTSFVVDNVPTLGALRTRIGEFRKFAGFENRATLASFRNAMRKSLETQNLETQSVRRINIPQYNESKYIGASFDVIRNNAPALSLRAAQVVLRLYPRGHLHSAYGHLTLAPLLFVFDPQSSPDEILKLFGQFTAMFIAITRSFFAPRLRALSDHTRSLLVDAEAKYGAEATRANADRRQWLAYKLSFAENILYDLDRAFESHMLPTIFASDAQIESGNDGVAQLTRLLQPADEPLRAYFFVADGSSVHLESTPYIAVTMRDFGERIGNDLFLPRTQSPTSSSNDTSVVSSTVDAVASLTNDLADTLISGTFGLDNDNDNSINYGDGGDNGDNNDDGAEGGMLDFFIGNDDLLDMNAPDVAPHVFAPVATPDEMEPEFWDSFETEFYEPVITAAQENQGVFSSEVIIFHRLKQRVYASVASAVYDYNVRFDFYRGIGPTLVHHDTYETISANLSGGSLAQVWLRSHINKFAFSRVAADKTGRLRAYSRQLARFRGRAGYSGRLTKDAFERSMGEQGILIPTYRSYAYARARFVPLRADGTRELHSIQGTTVELHLVAAESNGDYYGSINLGRFFFMYPRDATEQELRAIFAAFVATVLAITHTFFMVSIDAYMKHQIADMRRERNDARLTSEERAASMRITSIKMGFLSQLAGDLRDIFSSRLTPVFVNQELGEDSETSLLLRELVARKEEAVMDANADSSNIRLYKKSLQATAAAEAMVLSIVESQQEVLRLQKMYPVDGRVYRLAPTNEVDGDRARVFDLVAEAERVTLV